MSQDIVVAIITVVGTMLSSFCGIMMSNKLVNYRLSALEEKVNKHNNLVERMALVEASAKSAHRRLDEWKGEH